MELFFDASLLVIPIHLAYAIFYYVVMADNGLRFLGLSLFSFICSLCGYFSFLYYYLSSDIHLPLGGGLVVAGYWITFAIIPYLIFAVIFLLLTAQNK